jgi:hypothetical protein
MAILLLLADPPLLAALLLPEGVEGHQDSLQEVFLEVRAAAERMADLVEQEILLL